MNTFIRPEAEQGHTESKPMRYQFHSYDDYIEARLAYVEQQRDDLLAAARSVCENIEGELPISGWLRDNDKSRIALGTLRVATAKALGVPAEQGEAK